MVEGQPSIFPGVREREASVMLPSALCRNWEVFQEIILISCPVTSKGTKNISANALAIPRWRAIRIKVLKQPVHCRSITLRAQVLQEPRKARENIARLKKENKKKLHS